MAFRVVLIESEAALSLKLNNLIINKGDGDIWIPLDDISVIVADNMHISFTARMLSLLAEKNISLILTNQEHLPIGYFSSYDNHSRISKTIGFQLSREQLYYDSFWKELVRNKIENQRKVLVRLSMGEAASAQLRGFCEELTDGDPTNREAHAAKVYFNTLMGNSFSRGNEDLLFEACFHISP